MRNRARGAFLAVVLSVAFAGAAAPMAWAQSSSSSALDATLEQADKLGKQAKALAAQKKWAQAAATLEKAIDLETGLLAKLSTQQKVPMMLIIARDQRQLASYHVEAGDYGRAAAQLERVIRLYELLPASTDEAKDVPKLRKALADLRKLGGSSSSGGTTKAAPPSKSEADQLTEKAAQAITLWKSDKTSEAAVLMDAILPSVDATTKLEPATIAVVNLAAGKIYEDSAQISKAEARLKRSLEQHERLYGRSSKMLVEVLKALGDFYANTMEHERAAPHYVRAFDIAKAEAEDQVGPLMLSLARVVETRGDYPEAAQIVQRARAVLLERSGGKKQIDFLMASIMLARIEEERGRFDAAEALYEEVRAELEPQYRASPKDMAPIWAAFLYTNGWHHRKRENWSRAEAFLKEALALKRTAFKGDSLVVANAECDLGEVYWASGDLPRSLDPIQRCFDAREVDVARVLATGSEDQKRAYISWQLIAYQKTLTAQQLAGNGNGKLTRLALGQVLRTKGRVLDAMSGESQAIRRGASPELKQLLDRLATTRTLLSQESQSGRNAARITQLEEEARTLEQRIAEKSEPFRAATKRVDVDSVRAAIPKGHVLVEMVAFDPLDPKYKRIADRGATRYLAYVVHPSGGPETTVVDLGPVAPIDDHVKALRAALGDPDVDPSAPARELYERVVMPLERSLGGATKVLLSPDGALNSVPFAAFAKDGKYLVDSYSFSYVTSGRDLLRWGASRPRSDAFVVVADPDFAMNGALPAPGSRFANVKFPPLPGTDGEAQALRRMFKGARLLTKRAATEAALKRVEHPQVLHIATHGFFLKGEPLRLTSTRGLELDMGEARRSTTKSESPLLRSGLALAGAASLSGNDGQDGILTALEATSLDLVGTRLVVLSACQTAEGETQNGEGVYGLRRALSIAGAETLVMSLWAVDDEATSYLMQRYYDRLKKGGGRAEALRETQIEMAKAKAVSHPYFWAAFIPSGETSPMELPRDPSPSSRSSSSRPSSSSRDSAGSSDDFLPEVGRRWGAPFMAGTFGLSRITLTPTGGAPPGRSELEGDTLHVGFDVGLLSLAFNEVGEDVRRGFALYDRAAISLAGVSMGGDDVGGNQLDYRVMLGYRTRFLGLFGGVMAGTGSMAFDDDFRATGPFVPAAARVELPWWWGSRLTANGYAFKIAGVREVEGVDARLPLFTRNLWLGVRYDHLRGRSDQVAEGRVMTFSLGVGESR